MKQHERCGDCKLPMFVLNSEDEVRRFRNGCSIVRTATVSKSSPLNVLDLPRVGDGCCMIWGDERFPGLIQTGWIKREDRLVHHTVKIVSMVGVVNA